MKTEVFGVSLERLRGEIRTLEDEILKARARENAIAELERVTTSDLESRFPAMKGAK